jgi:hypothetical protein
MKGCGCLLGTVKASGLGVKWDCPVIDPVGPIVLELKNDILLPEDTTIDAIIDSFFEFFWKIFFKIKNTKLDPNPFTRFCDFLFNKKI